MQNTYLFNHHRFFVLMVVACLLFASCAGGKEKVEISSAPIPTQTATPMDQPGTGSENGSQAPIQEMITVITDEGEIQIPKLPPTDLTEFLEEKVAQGEWTQEEGIIKLLSLFSGDVQFEELLGIENVVETEGTGIADMAVEMIENQDTTETTRAELQRLLSSLAPSREVLDKISQPADSAYTISNKVAKISQPAWADQQDYCSQLAGQGFVGNVDPGTVCFLFKEANLGSNTFRVYYPHTWQGDPALLMNVSITLDAMAESAAKYSSFPSLSVKNVNVIFSLNASPRAINQWRILAIKIPFDIDKQDCPLTIFPIATNIGLDAFKQTLAHEMFHCVQAWSFDSLKPNRSNAWWKEGTAEYFSNLVYPTVNYEWESLKSFNEKSPTTPINQMKYENFLFFQFLGNTYGNTLLIDALKQVAAAGGDIQKLNNLDHMKGNFNQFVVQFMSSGIQDTGGGTKLPETMYYSGTRTISDVGEQEFTSNLWIAGRYLVTYEKEKRFLQTPVTSEDGNYSTVELTKRLEKSAWSALPPEVRSECKKDKKYIFAVTTTGTSYTFKSSINKVDKASCDPCLFGTWDTLPDKYAMNASVTALGGHQFSAFNEQGNLQTKRSGFNILASEAGQSLELVIDGHGFGNYSADGEKLIISNFEEFTDDVGVFVNGIEMQISGGMFNQMNLSMFGKTFKPAGADFDNTTDSPSDVVAGYVCNEKNLVLTTAFGSMELIRVDVILPTPIPTPGP